MRTIVWMLLVSSLLSGCAFAPAAEPHDVDLDNLPADVLFPVELQRVERVLSATEIEDRIDALERGEPVEPIFTRIKPQEITERVVADVDFVIYVGQQPGIYTADVWFGGVPAGQAGEVWFRATDVLWGDSLSVETLRDKSLVGVVSPGATDFEYIPGPDNNIFIREGDRGDPYPVRFDLVYQADGVEDHVVLLSKTYLIEGFSH